MRTSSPGRAPARASARSTPSRFRRRWTRATASGSVRSDSPTACSASRPTTTKPEPSRADDDPFGDRPVHHWRRRGHADSSARAEATRSARRPDEVVNPLRRSSRRARGRGRRRPAVESSASEIGPRADDEARPVDELRAEAPELGEQGGRAGRRAGVLRSAQRSTRTTSARARSTWRRNGGRGRAPRSPLDEAGDVGDDELAHAWSATGDTRRRRDAARAS